MVRPRQAPLVMTAAGGPEGLRPRDSTVMEWSADVAIHGKLASAGSRLIEGTVKKVIGQTFDCIRS